MDLKLAEYDLETGKFEKFRKCGSDSGEFSYAVDMIGIWEDFGFTNGEWYDFDEKDPLNRFDGRFDNRSYGNGRFVLIADDEDDIFQCFNVLETWHRRRGDVNPSELEDYHNDCYDGDDYRVCAKLGNLHESPELYDKIK